MSDWTMSIAVVKWRDILNVRQILSQPELHACLLA